MKVSLHDQQANELERMRAMARDLHSDDLIDDDDSDNNAPIEPDWITEANAWLERATKELQVALAQAANNLEKTKQMRLEVNELIKQAKAFESQMKTPKKRLHAVVVPLVVTTRVKLKRIA